MLFPTKKRRRFCSVRGKGGKERYPRSFKKQSVFGGGKKLPFHPDE